MGPQASGQTQAPRATAAGNRIGKRSSGGKALAAGPALVVAQHYNRLKTVDGVSGVISSRPAVPAVLRSSRRPPGPGRPCVPPTFARWPDPKALESLRRKSRNSPRPPCRSPWSPPEFLPASAPLIAARPFHSANSFPSARRSPAASYSPRSLRPDGPPPPPPQSALSARASARWSRTRAPAPGFDAPTPLPSQTRFQICPAPFPLPSSPADRYLTPSKTPPMPAFLFSTLSLAFSRFRFLFHFPRKVRREPALTP